jgi:hypothetical protein
MSQLPGSGASLERRPHRQIVTCWFTPAKPGRSRRNVTRKAQPSLALRHAKRRQLRCDCGRIAVKVLHVKVGSDPQYTVSLPLCSMCLSLEEGMHAEA